MSLSGFKVTKAPEQPVVSRRIQTAPAELPAAVAAALSEVIALATARDAGPGVHYIRRLEASATELDVEVGVCVRRPLDDDSRLPSGKLACGVWTGPFASRAHGHAELAARAVAEGLEPLGPSWEVPLTGPTDTEVPEQGRAQLYLPVR